MANPPGTRKHCNCLTFLQLLCELPDGPFCEGFESFAGPGGSGVKLGYMIYEWGWCPGCGGRLGKFRPELKEAYAAYKAAVEGPYERLKGRLTWDEVRERCSELGAVEDDSGPYYATFWDRKASVAVNASYDPDHETVYASFSFSPHRKYRRDPFVEGSVKDRDPPLT